MTSWRRWAEQVAPSVSPIPSAPPPSTPAVPAPDSPIGAVRMPVIVSAPSQEIDPVRQKRRVGIRNGSAYSVAAAKFTPPGNPTGAERENALQS